MLLATLLAGCGPKPAADELSQVPLSAELRPALEASRRSLRARDGGEPAVRRELDQYYALMEGLARADERATAAETLYALWNANLRGVLWPELAATYRNLLPDAAPFDALYSRPDFPDTSAALGAWLREWRKSRPTPNGSGFVRAWDARSELAPWPRVWLQLRMARYERQRGNSDEATRLAIAALPEARALGGWRLELEAWSQAVRALRYGDHLDDALHAATIAEALARAVARQTGNTYVVPLALLEKAQVLGDRRETAAALRMFEACADSAVAAGLTPLASECLNRAGIFTGGVGEERKGLEYYRRSLALALADHDSLYVPRHLANIGQRLLALGFPDSCGLYLAEAERWIRAYPDSGNRARFTLFQAKYFARIGDFAAVDSLQMVARRLQPDFSSIVALAELHLELIQQGVERGRAQQAYRSIAVLDSLRGRLGTSFGDRNELFDLDVASAGFLALQGSFGQATEALARAESALVKRPDPRRGWELARARGDVARMRGDHAAAESAYRECLRLATDRHDADRQAQSRLWLGSALLGQSRFDDVRALFPPDTAASFGGRFRTALSGILLAATAESRRGRFESALGELDRARARCRAESPPDLLVRLDLETGRALAGLGRHDDARRAFDRAQTRLAREHEDASAQQQMFLDQDVRRELAECMLNDRVDASGGALRGREALAALRELERLLPAWRTSEARSNPPLQTPQLVYFVGTGASYRWTANANDVSLARLPGEDSLMAVMAPVLADMRQPGRRIAPAELAELARALGGGVSGWPAGSTLTIAPDGPLFAIPWAALPGDGGAEPNWIDHGPIVLAQAPVHAGGRAAPGHGGRLLALGVDGSAGEERSGLARLHHAEREARDVAALWPAGRATLRVGARAGRGVLASGELSQYDVVHVSSHALVTQGFADRTSLLLAGAGRAPVTAAEIGQLKLHADLVFLSCCEAAESVRRGVGPGHAGLARSFLAAGARCVIAPATRIEDEPARRFATRFYAHWLRGLSVEAALRQAQLDGRGPDPGRAHAYDWAFYQVSTE